VLHATPAGAGLARKYLSSPEYRVLTADLALVELSAKLARDGRAREIRSALAAVSSASGVLPVTTAAAAASGPLLVELRKTHREASLADAVMLAVARCEGARLISGDACFANLRDVSNS